MRFALAVLAAAALDLVVFLRIDQWFGASALFADAYIAMASLGAGFFCGSRAPLAGGLAVICGALLSGAVQYVPRFAYANDPGVLLGFELQLITAFVPYAIGGALVGSLGGRLRHRVVGS